MHQTKSTLHNCNHNAYASSSSGSLSRNEPGSCGILTGSNVFGLGQTQPVAASLNQRCASPLILHNNVSPHFGNGQSQSPFVETQSRPFSQLKERFQKPVESPRGAESAGLNQLPKRTVSLGPRRPLAERPQFSGALSQFRNQTEAGPNLENRGRRFSRLADELQSSLTELDQLIDAPAQGRQQNSGRPPKFTSYVTSTPEPEPSFARRCPGFKPTSPDSPPAGPQPFTWQLDIDPQNWKASSSINDLRSMFEQQKQPTSNLSSSTMSLNRPPRSESSKLRQSPFHTGQINQQQHLQPVETSGTNRPVSSSLGADYTIRRTISTSGRTNNRNPYRSHYGNF